MCLCASRQGPGNVGIGGCLALTREVDKCCLLHCRVGSCKWPYFVSSHWFFCSSSGPERIVSPERGCLVSLERKAWGRTLQKTVQAGMGPASWRLSRALSQPLQAPLQLPFTAVWPQVIIGTLRVPGSFPSHVSDHFTRIN